MHICCAEYVAVITVPDCMPASQSPGRGGRPVRTRPPVALAEPLPPDLSIIQRHESSLEPPALQQVAGRQAPSAALWAVSYHWGVRADDRAASLNQGN